MNATRQKLVRDVIAAKRAMDVAHTAYNDAKHAYRLAESLFLKEWPIPGQRPSSVYCDPYMIEVLDNWQHASLDEPRLDFTNAEQCPTSE